MTRNDINGMDFDNHKKSGDETLKVLKKDFIVTLRHSGKGLVWSWLPFPVLNVY
ncbi:MAG: hypothetical protein ACE5D1_06490 [Fidelibacterota bacterium]